MPAPTQCCYRLIKCVTSFDPEPNKPLNRCSAHQREEEKQSMSLESLMWYGLQVVSTVEGGSFIEAIPLCPLCVNEKFWVWFKVIDPPNSMVYKVWYLKMIHVVGQKWFPWSQSQVCWGNRISFWIRMLPICKSLTTSQTAEISNIQVFVFQAYDSQGL